jgi:hypothetical protein
VAPAAEVARRTFGKVYMAVVRRSQIWLLLFEHNITHQNAATTEGNTCNYLMAHHGETSTTKYAPAACG